jgi:hypothetical protein
VRYLWIAAAVAAASAPARADDPTSSDEPPATFHKGQIGFSARLAFGYRFIAPHDGNKTYCGVTDTNEASTFASVCTGRAPTALDLEAAYGVAQHIELLFELGLGLESDFGPTQNADGPHPLHIAPGARFFFSEAKHSKLFVQPMLLMDVSGYNTATGSRGTEYGARFLEGYWIDVHRAYGFYVFLGETAGFTPWLEGTFEGGFGLQGRYP